MATRAYWQGFLRLSLVSIAVEIMDALRNSLDARTTRTQKSPVAKAPARKAASSAKSRTAAKRPAKKARGR
jgi:non-homologous end joining protein Ku